MKWTVTAVPSSEYRNIWPTVAPLLRPAIAYSGGRISAKSVLEWLKDGRYLLWVIYPDDKVIRAAMVTRVAQYPMRKMLTVDALGGSEMNGWLEDVSRVLRAFSQESGLDGVEAFGRPGWLRALSKFGWQQSGVLVETL